MINTAYITPLNVFLAWLSVVSLVLFFYSFYRLKKSNEKLNIIGSDEDKRWKELEVKAQNDYQEIISEANKRASEIIAQATAVNHDSIKAFDDSVAKMIQNQKSNIEQKSEEISKKHEDEINELNNNIIKLLINVYKEIEIATRADLENYKAVIKQQTFEAEKIAQERMKTEYEKLEKEIAEKKQERLKQLENNIYKILNNISKDIIGKSLDLTSHEELIINSMEKAKKEGVI
jgi:F0F1-type ATP synthase membrane subunit b/b'